MLLDLGGFKAIKDTHGPGTGDEARRVVAQRLRSTANVCDLAAPSHQHTRNNSLQGGEAAGAHPQKRRTRGICGAAGAARLTPRRPFMLQQLEKVAAGPGCGPSRWGRE